MTDAAWWARDVQVRTKHDDLGCERITRQPEVSHPARVR